MRRTSIAARLHRVTLQSPGPAVPDGDGGFLPATWINLDPSQVDAEILPATARDLERVASGTVLSTASHVVTFPYHPQVSVSSRIVFGDRVFSVTGVSNPEERNVETIALCVELLGALPLGVDGGAPGDLGIDGGTPDDGGTGLYDGGVV